MSPEPFGEQGGREESTKALRILDKMQTLYCSKPFSDVINLEGWCI